MAQQQYNPEGKAQLYKTPDATMQKSPRAPHLKARFVFQGVPYEIALWPATEQDGGRRTDRNGNGYYTGTVKVDTYAQQKAAPPQQPAPAPAYQPPQQAPPPPQQQAYQAPAPPPADPPNPYCPPQSEDPNEIPFDSSPR